MTTIPDGKDVERLATLMAAAVGVPWLKLSAEDASGMRVMANAALMNGALPDAESAMLVLRARLEDAAAAVREAAERLEGGDEAEHIIQRLHRGATTIEALVASLGEDEGEEF